MKFLPARNLFLGLLGGALIAALDPPLGLGAELGLLILFALDAALARRLGAPDLEIDVRGRMGQDEEGEVAVSLANRIGRPLRMRLALDVPEAIAGEGALEAARVALEPLERARIAFALEARERGAHEVGALHFRILGPLRLAWWQSRVPVGRTVEVVPGLREVRSYRLLALHHQLAQAGLRNVRLRGEGGAFESLREYVRGDDPRHISWKASARHGALIVRQYEAERSQSILLCIDAGRLMAERVGEGGASGPGRERLDRALAAATVLDEVARAWNDQVGVFAFSDRVQAFLPPGRHPPDRIPGIFARLRSRPVEPDYPRALTALSRSLRRRSLVIFFGDVIDDEVSGPLAAHLAQLARRHLALFVALRNSSLFALAGSPAADRPAAYLRAAAAELVLERSRTLSRMRERGILVADVAPEAAVAAAVNRYIEIKRRGAL